MADSKLNVRISADLTEVRRALNQLTTELGNFKRTAAKKPSGGDFTDTLSKGLDSAAGKLKGLVAAYASIQGLQAFARLSDEAAELSAKLKLATKSQDEYNKAAEGTADIANRTRTSIKSTIELYARLERSTRDLGLSQDTLLRLTETINKAGQLSGGGAGVEAAIFQLTQGLVSGTLRGEELNSVLEQMPRLASAIADGMGKPIGQLRKLAEEGELTAEVVARALLKTGDQVDQEFSQMPVTVGGAVTQVKNALVAMVGESNEASGAQKDLAESIGRVADILKDPSTAQAFAKVGTAIATLTGLAIEATTEFAELGHQWGLIAARAQQRVFGNGISQLDDLEAQIGDVDRALKNSFMGKPTKFLFTSEAELKRIKAQLTAERDALLAAQGGLPKGGGSGAPAPNVGIPAQQGVSAKVKELTDKLREQAAALGLVKSKQLELDKQRALSKAANAAEKQAITEAYDALIAKQRAEEGATKSAKNRSDLIAQQVAQAELVVDSVRRAITALDALYQDGGTSAKAYFAERERLETEAIDAQLAQARADLSIAEGLSARQKALTEIAKLERERADIGPRTARDQAVAERELAATLEQVRARLADLQGDDGAARIAQLKRERDETLKAFTGDEAAKADIARLFDLEAVRAKLKAIEGEASKTIDNLRSQEALLAAQIEAGQVSPIEAEEQLQATRQASIDQLVLYQQKLADLYASSKDPAVLAELRKVQTEISRVAAEQNRLENSIADAATGALSGFFADLATGAKSFKDAFLDMVRSFVQGVAQMIAQELALKAIKGATSFFGIGVNHAGGMAGAGATRRMPAAAAAALFAGAPRYHQGGIAGLKPGEVPAILQTGEEVLTRSDPRNVVNGGRSGAGTGTRVINVVDPSLVEDYMTSAAGEQTVLNIIGRNPGFIKQTVG